MWPAGWPPCKDNRSSLRGAATVCLHPLWHGGCPLESAEWLGGQQCSRPPWPQPYRSCHRECSHALAVVAQLMEAPVARLQLQHVSRCTSRGNLIKNCPCVLGSLVFVHLCPTQALSSGHGGHRVRADVGVVLPRAFRHLGLTTHPRRRLATLSTAVVANCLSEDAHAEPVHTQRWPQGGCATMLESNILHTGMRLFKACP